MNVSEIENCWVVNGALSEYFTIVAEAGFKFKTESPASAIGIPVSEVKLKFVGAKAVWKPYELADVPAGNDNCVGSSVKVTVSVSPTVIVEPFGRFTVALMKSARTVSAPEINMENAPMSVTAL